MKRFHGESGLATIELVLMTPVLLVALGFLVVAGRLTAVRGDLAAASRDAARAASLAGTHDQAALAAEAAAQANLGGRDITCRNLSVVLGDPSTFHPGGTVSVSVTCDVSLADVAVPGLPGSRSVSARSVEIIDQYRSGP